MSTQTLQRTPKNQPRRVCQFHPTPYPNHPQPQHLLPGVPSAAGTAAEGGAASTAGTGGDARSVSAIVGASASAAALVEHRGGSLIL